MTIQTGTFGSVILTANAAQAVCSNNGTTAAVANINFCNQGSLTAGITLAISFSSTFGAVSSDQFMDWLTPVQGRTPYERTGRPLAPGETIWAMANANNVAVQVYGIVSEV